MARLGDVEVKQKEHSTQVYVVPHPHSQTGQCTEGGVPKKASGAARSPIGGESEPLADVV